MSVSTVELFQTVSGNFNMELRFTLDELREFISTEPYRKHCLRERFVNTSAHPRSNHRDGQAVDSLQTNAPRVLSLRMHLLSIQAWALSVRNAVKLRYRFALRSRFVVSCVFLGGVIDEGVHYLMPIFTACVAALCDDKSGGSDQRCNKKTIGKIPYPCDAWARNKHFQSGPGF